MFLLLLSVLLLLLYLVELYLVEGFIKVTNDSNLVTTSLRTVLFFGFQRVKRSWSILHYTNVSIIIISFIIIIIFLHIISPVKVKSG